MTVVLTRPQLARLVRMAGTIEAVDAVMAELARGRAVRLLPVNADTGGTLAILDGAVPTRVRTAATSAVATRR